MITQSFVDDLVDGARPKCALNDLVKAGLVTVTLVGLGCHEQVGVASNQDDNRHYYEVDRSLHAQSIPIECPTDKQLESEFPTHARAA